MGTLQRRSVLKRLSMEKEALVDQVAGSMAIDGFVLTEEDKERIRLLADNPDDAEKIVQQLVKKHKYTDTHTNKEN